MPEWKRSRGPAPVSRTEAEVEARTTHRGHGVSMPHRWDWHAAMVLSALILVGGAVLAACSSSSPSRSVQPAKSSATTPSSSSTSGTVDTVTSGTYGTYLVDSAGYALYALSSNPPDRSTCSDACAAVWPPLTENGALTGGAGVNATELGTITSTHQVTYDHHALYTFTHDTAPGQTNGEGVVAFGGTWTLMSAAGTPIAPRASSSGGYTY